MRAAARVSSGDTLGSTSSADDRGLAVGKHMQRALPQRLGERRVGDDEDAVHAGRRRGSSIMRGRPQEVEIRQHAASQEQAQRAPEGARPRRSRHARTASISRPMPHWTTKTPRNTTRLYAESARPASAGGQAPCATAGWASDTTVEPHRKSVQASVPAAGPSTRMAASTSMLSGRPQAISRSAAMPRRASHGLAHAPAASR